MRLDVKRNIRIFYTKLFGCLPRGTGARPVNGHGQDGPCHFKISHYPAECQDYVKVRVPPGFYGITREETLTRRPDLVKTPAAEGQKLGHFFTTRLKSRPSARDDAEFRLEALVCNLTRSERVP